MASQLEDTVEITIPRERDFSIVAELVVGGIAARHDVTLDVLDDLQLALGSLLENDDDEAEGEISVVLSVGGDVIEASVGPLCERTVVELEADTGEELGLRRLLDTTVDEVSLSTRPGGTWVQLRKGFASAGLER
ncbi:MAG: hypothetical protein ABIR67_13900 [Gaiellaceae bacterium]